MKEFQALTLFLGLHIEPRNSESQMITQGKTILTDRIGKEPRQKKTRVQEYNYHAQAQRESGVQVEPQTSSKYQDCNIAQR